MVRELRVRVRKFIWVNGDVGILGVGGGGEGIVKGGRY